MKDLVDMLLMLELGLAPTPLLQASINATFERYARHPLPARLPEPPDAWRTPFAALTEDLGLEVTELDAAYQRIRAFLDEVRGSK